MPNIAEIKNEVLINALKNTLTIEQAASQQDVNLSDMLQEFNSNIFGNKIIFSNNVNKAEMNIVKSIDARPMLARGGHPLALVLEEANKINAGEFIELITPFKPLPLLDIASQNGLKVSSNDGENGIYRSFFGK